VKNRQDKPSDLSYTEKLQELAKERIKKRGLKKQISNKRG